MPNLASLLPTTSLKATVILLALTTLTAAQDYPTKPVRVIIPFPPGAINDTVGRLIATELTNRMGKQFIVDNRAGAGGVVGTELAANAPKDGYTLLVVSLVNTVNPWLYRLNYEPIKSFAPIAFVASSPNILVVNPQVPAKTLGEFIALAKKQPGKVQYASGGVGSFMHLGGELFKLSAGVDLLHVPFRGGGPAMTDVMGGHTNAAFATIPTATPQVNAGRVRALAVGASKRQAALPDVPTADEAGLPGYHVSNWVGLVAPAGAPPAIVDKLNKEIAAIMQTPDMQKQLANQGLEFVSMTPAEFGTFMEKELAKWGRVVKEGGITAQ
ncbi:MAG: tripartite tricarboxylate transporter substrate binding protein [Xanthobacteraceae bacterium]|nr:tripartite tricarboxylate transporter substrate binding protein [Xanthobacteraceae bacterium]